MMAFQKNQAAKLFFFLSFLILSVLLIIAPFSQPMGTIRDLSGSVWAIDHTNITSKMNFPWNWIYAFGDFQCHQKKERSFLLNDNQMPVCARCTGILSIGIPMGFLAAILIPINLTKLDEGILRRMALIFAISYTPVAIDGIGQLIGLWESTNLIRLLTGTLMGFGSGLIFAIAIDFLYLALKKGMRASK